MKTIRTSKANEVFRRKSTIDAILTLGERFFSIPEVEELVIEDEKRDGTASFFNNIWKPQEIIYRCNKTSKITWTVQCICDGIKSGRYRDNAGRTDIPHAVLKTGSRSITDVFMTTSLLKNHIFLFLSFQSN